MFNKNKMKQAFILLTGLLSFLSNLLFAQFQHLDQTIPRLMKDAHVPGLSVAVIEGSRVVYSNAFGLRSNDGSAPVDDQTVFAAASLSKPLFAFGVMQLVEEGRFDLDRPLVEYIDYEDLRHDPRYRRITARMVLSHTSGLPNWRNGRLEFQGDPGDRFRYSGEGFVFLQKAIERITGQTLEDFLQQRVLKPLSMNRSSYVWQKPFEDNYAIPHDDLGVTQGKYKPKEPNAAYSLQTTAADYAKFVIAMLNGIGLRKSSIDQMTTTQAKVPVRNDNPDLLSNAVSWGLGWGLQDSDYGKAFWHWGDNGTFRCFIAGFPERKAGILFFTNSNNGLSFVEELVRQTFNSNCPACAWIDYARYDQPAFYLVKNILDKGFDAAMAPYLDANGKHQNTSLLPEGAMNDLGYKLMRANRLSEAKRVFLMNMLAFPNSANVYDSYAEACLRNGETILARDNYERAFELDKNNKVAESIVKQLSGRGRGNTTFVLNGYSNARLVTVAGDFNGWNDLSLPMRRRDGEWSCTTDLGPGVYNYKFIVDGIWIPDPGNLAISNDVNHNSMLEIKAPTRAAATTPAAAPSPAKETLSRYSDAIGGKAKWKDLKTYQMTLHDAGSNGNISYTMTMKKPNKFRMDFNNPANRMVKSYNGVKGVISINYRNQDMSPGEQQEMAEEVNFYDELLFADELGYVTEVVGTELIDDDLNALKIKLSKGKGDETFYYLDPKTYLPVMITEYSQDEAFKGMLFKTVLSDYREVDGLKFPFKMTLLANNRMMWSREVEELKVNPKVEDKVFELR
jgi:CubicO group peptidase (beta-lactamase class C family)/outer membrane lipoprotein-sorting protein